MQRTSSVFGLLVLVLAACGTKKASPDGGAGSIGADAMSTAGSAGATAGAGAGGVAGTTGVAGMSGNGGAGGAPATGVAGQGAAGTGVAGQGAAGTGVAGQGAAGAAGGGASGAAGGTGAGAGAGGAAGAGSGAECQTKQDCMLASDCCSCRAEPQDRPVDSCPATCTVDVCRANEIEENEVACVLGRCVLTRNCDTRAVTCLVDPPACPPGTVPSVRDSCWGPCLLPTECIHVGNCGACGAESVCVRSLQTGVLTVCATPAPDCRAGNYCQCLVTCPALCAEKDAGVECVCPGC